MGKEIGTVSLTRTGRMGLRFRGRKIASADDALPALQSGSKKKDERRWHELRLYERDSGGFVLEIVFRSGMDRELPNHAAFVCENADAVIDVLCGDDGYDQLEYLQGFPDADRFRDRQNRLEEHVTADYEDRVSKLLKDAEFFEEV